MSDGLSEAVRPVYSPSTGLRALLKHTQAIYDNYRASILQKLIDLVDDYMAFNGYTTYIDLQYIADNMLFATYNSMKIGSSETREELLVILRDGTRISIEKKTEYKKCVLINGGPEMKCTPLEHPKTTIHIEING